MAKYLNKKRRGFLKFAAGLTMLVLGLVVGAVGVYMLMPSHSQTKSETTTASTTSTVTKVSTTTFTETVTQTETTTCTTSPSHGC